MVSVVGTLLSTWLKGGVPTFKNHISDLSLRWYQDHFGRTTRLNIVGTTSRSSQVSIPFDLVCFRPSWYQLLCSARPSLPWPLTLTAESVLSSLVLGYFVITRKNRVQGDWQKNRNQTSLTKQLRATHPLWSQSTKISQSKWDTSIFIEHGCLSRSHLSHCMIWKCYNETILRKQMVPDMNITKGNFRTV